MAEIKTKKNGAREKGQEAEEYACRYLQKKGLILIERNYRSRFGEIDLIMRDGAQLVFIEVRQRRSLAFGGAAASVTWKKQQKIQKTAAHFLLKYKNLQSVSCRFDVISIQGEKADLAWLKNAFGQ